MFLPSFRTQNVCLDLAEETNNCHVVFCVDVLTERTDLCREYHLSKWDVLQHTDKFFLFAKEVVWHYWTCDPISISPPRSQNPVAQ